MASLSRRNPFGSTIWAQPFRCNCYYSSALGRCHVVELSYHRSVALHSVYFHTESTRTWLIARYQRQVSKSENNQAAVHASYFAIFLPVQGCLLRILRGRGRYT